MDAHNARANADFDAFLGRVGPTPQERESRQFLNIWRQKDPAAGRLNAQDFRRKNSLYAERGSQVQVIECENPALLRSAERHPLNEAAAGGQRGNISGSLVETVREFLRRNPGKALQIQVRWDDGTYAATRGFLTADSIHDWYGALVFLYSVDGGAGNAIEDTQLEWMQFTITDRNTIKTRGGRSETDNCLFECIFRKLGIRQEKWEEMAAAARKKFKIEPGPIECSRVADLEKLGLTFDIIDPKGGTYIYSSKTIGQKHHVIYLDEDHYYEMLAPSAEPADICAHIEILPKDTRESAVSGFGSTWGCVYTLRRGEGYGYYELCMLQNGAPTLLSHVSRARLDQLRQTPINGVRGSFKYIKIRNIKKDGKITQTVVDLKEEYAKLASHRKLILDGAGFDIFRVLDPGESEAKLAMAMWRELTPELRLEQMPFNQEVLIHQGGGLMIAEKGFEGFVVGADYKSFYPGIQQSKYRVPVKAGRVIDAAEALKVIEEIRGCSRMAQKNFPVALLEVTGAGLEELTRLPQKRMLTSYEIWYAIQEKQGVTFTVREDSRHLLWTPEQTLPLADVFGKFVETLFALKEAAKTEADRSFVKSILNTLWGACKERNKGRKTFTPNGSDIEGDGIITGVFYERRKQGITVEMRDTHAGLFLGPAAYLSPFVAGIGRYRAASLVDSLERAGKKHGFEVRCVRWHTDGGFFTGDIEKIKEFVGRRKAGESHGKNKLVVEGEGRIQVHHLNKQTLLPGYVSYE